MTRDNKTALLSLLVAALLLAIPAKGGPTKGLEPRAVFCFERVLLYSRLSIAAINDPRLKRFQDGVEQLNRLEHASLLPFIEGLAGTDLLIDEPILAIELDAILETAPGSIEPTSLLAKAIHFLQQRARRQIFETLLEHLSTHQVPTAINPLTKTQEVDRLASEILEDFERTWTSALEASLVQKIDRLSETDDLEVLGKSIFWLQGILAAKQSTKQTVTWMGANLNNPNSGLDLSEYVPQGASEDHRRADLLIAAIHRSLGQCFYRLYKRASKGPDSDTAEAYLKWAGGGDARSVLNDIEAVRAGRSPFALWIAANVKNDSAETAHPSYVLAQARAIELSAGAMDGRPFPVQLTSEPLWEFVEQLPLTLTNGQRIPRVREKIQDQTMILLAGLQKDPRSDNPEAQQAIQMAALLVGDPRVDAQSLYDWAHSLFGERRSFQPVAFVRFLQEANAVIPIVMSLDLQHRALISREHKKDITEELGPSFDLWIIDTRTNLIVGATEIKQTFTPRNAHDIGGILKQATSKLDGEIIFPAIESELGRNLKYRLLPGAANNHLRHLLARRSLIIQIPWSQSPTEYARGGLTLVVQADGTVERWRRAGEQQKGVKLGEDKLFEQIADHFAKVPDADYFDEIRLTDVSGRIVVTYLQRHSPEKGWQIIPGPALAH